MSLFHRNYCVTCEWSANTETYSDQEVASQAIEHVVETGHDIESGSIVDLS